MKILREERCLIPDKPLYRFGTDEQGCQLLKFSPDGLLLIAAVTKNDSSTSLQLFDIRNGSRMYFVKGHMNIVHDLDWNPTSEYLLSASSDFTVGVSLHTLYFLLTYHSSGKSTEICTREYPKPRSRKRYA